MCCVCDRCVDEHSRLTRTSRDGAPVTLISERLWERPLGATSAAVLRLVLGQGSRLAGAGIVLGLAGALGVTRVLKELLFGVSASDAATFAATALVLGTVAVAATLIPRLARRAHQSGYRTAPGVRVLITRWPVV